MILISVRPTCSHLEISFLRRLRYCLQYTALITLDKLPGFAFVRIPPMIVSVPSLRHFRHRRREAQSTLRSLPFASTFFYSCCTSTMASRTSPGTGPVVIPPPLLGRLPVWPPLSWKSLLQPLVSRLPQLQYSPAAAGRHRRHHR
jgi:hypothetical protein